MRLNENWPPERLNGDPAASDMRRAGELFTQLPPHAIEAEISVLGSMLIDPSVIPEVQRVLGGPDEFSNPTHGLIYQAMLDCYGTHGGLDIVQLHQSLIDRNMADAVGGVGELLKLAMAVPSAHNAKHYAAMVREKATGRRFIELAGKIVTCGYDEPGAIGDHIRQIRQELDALGRRVGGAAVETATLAEGFIDPADCVVGTLPTRLAWFDMAMAHGALARGEVIAWVAPPKLLKSAFNLFIMLSVLEANPDAVGLWCLGEMSHQTLGLRALAVLSGMCSTVLRERTETMRPGLRERKLRGMARLRQLGERLRVLPGPFTAEDIDRAAQTYEPDVIVVDYLQRVQPDIPCNSRREEVEAISRRLPEIAIERDAAVMVISNMSKAAADGSVSLAGVFKESSTIGYDIDAGFVAVLPDDLRDDFQAGRTLPERHAMTWRCLGNRNGDPRSIQCVAERATQRFFGPNEVAV